MNNNNILCPRIRFEHLHLTGRHDVLKPLFTHMRVINDHKINRL
jgi:hypothetical protein